MNDSKYATFRSKIETSDEYIKGQTTLRKFKGKLNEYNRYSDKPIVQDTGDWAILNNWEWVVPRKIVHEILIAMGHGYSYHLSFRQLRNGNNQSQLYVLNIPVVISDETQEIKLETRG